MSTATKRPAEPSDMALAEHFNLADLRLNDDLRAASRLLGQIQARRLVDQYYQMQDQRIRTAGQVRAAPPDQTRELMDYFLTQWKRLEANGRKALAEFADTYRVGQWAQSICGIGPVITAGLLAHLDVRGKDTPCPWNAFAGLDPTRVWEKKTKRPWNAQLKTLLAFKLGECFVKVQSRKNDYYGQLFRGRKDLETAKNDRLAFADQAERILADKNFNKSTDAYKAYSAGRLPPAHIHARARRWAVKMFLSHLHHVSYLDFYGRAPAQPPIFRNPALNDNGRHTHYIEPPNLQVFHDSDGRTLAQLYAVDENQAELIDQEKARKKADKDAEKTDAQS